MDDSLGGLVSYTYDARNELINETLSGRASPPWLWRTRTTTPAT